MVYLRRASVVVLCLFACSASRAATPAESSVSTSRQFLVYGPDLRSRGVICDLAEDAKNDVLRLIGQRDTWRTPIVICAQYPQANLPEMSPAVLSLGQTGFGLKLQLNLILAPDMARPDVRRELLKAVLLEMMYRSAPDLPAGATYTSAPDWLLDGLETGTGGIARAWLTRSAGSKVLSLEEFLRQRPDPLDPLGRSVYRAYSRALLDLLAQLPDGRCRLAQFIFDLPAASGDGAAHLRLHFPELFDAASSSQDMWLSYLAALPEDQSPQSLSCEESERILDETLSLRIPGAHGRNYQLQQFPLFVHYPPARAILFRLRRDLSVLVARANPIYRSEICEYEEIATLLARGKTHRIAERLLQLSSSRRALVVQMRKIGDYMNWFEAVESSEPSGLFLDYLKAADLVGGMGERRRDRISVYLDVVETQFQNRN